MKSRELLLQSELNRFVRILKDNYDPQSIIVFGSLCAGKIKEWSDIGLVIIKNTYKPFFNRLKEVLSLLKPKVGVDILVYNTQEFKKMREKLFIK